MWYLTDILLNTEGENGIKKNTYICMIICFVKVTLKNVKGTRELGTRS